METEYSKILKYLRGENWSIENIDNGRNLATKGNVQFVLTKKDVYSETYGRQGKALDVEYDKYINSILSDIAKVSIFNTTDLYDIILGGKDTDESLSDEFTSFRKKVLDKIADKLNKKYSHFSNSSDRFDISSFKKNFYTSMNLHNTEATLNICYEILKIDFYYGKIDLVCLFGGVPVTVDISKISLDNLVLIHDSL